VAKHEATSESGSIFQMAVFAKFLTPREMAVRLGVSVHLVRSVLESLDEIPPEGFADNVPIYSQKSFSRVRYELNLLEAKEAQNDE
jgi:hypothetical protein